ncbi:MAG: diguanylate cyclase domain-containing protein [Leptolyngbyaceae cyanobacterium]
MAGFFGSDNDLSHVHQLQQMLQQQIRLREAIQRIRRVLDAQNVYRVAVQELLDFFKADWVFILGHGLNLWRSSDQLRHSGNVDNSATLNAYCELENAAAKLGKPLPIVVNEQSLQQFPVGQKWLNQYPGSWLLIPIPLFPGHQLQTDKTEKPWGLVAIGSKDGKNRWSSTQQEQVKLLVDEVAIALNHSLKYQQLKQDKLELRELALTDSLTGLANRRQFDDYFKAEWQRLAREQQPLTLILCDIDYFKLYNDYYGHPTGDICLAKVSDVLNRCIRRPADLVARYGGEEFAVVLPNTNTEGGHSVALAIQKQLAQVAIPHFTSSVSKAVTLTMGIATVVPEHQRTSQDLLQAADLALYHAKQQGRDRIYVHAHYCVQSHNCSGSLAQVANPDLSQPNN